MTGKHGPNMKIASKQGGSRICQLTMIPWIKLGQSFSCCSNCMQQQEEWVGVKQWRIGTRAWTPLPFPQYGGESQHGLPQRKAASCCGQNTTRVFCWDWLEQEGQKLEPLQGVAMTFCPYFCQLHWKTGYSVPILSENQNHSRLDQCSPLPVYKSVFVESGSKFCFTPWKATTSVSLLFPLLDPLGDSVPRCLFNSWPFLCYQQSFNLCLQSRRETNGEQIVEWMWSWATWSSQPCLSREGWTRWPPEGSSNPNHPVIDSVMFLVNHAVSQFSLLW